MSDGRVAAAQPSLVVGLSGALVPGHGALDETVGGLVMDLLAAGRVDHAGAPIGPQLDDAACLEIAHRLVVREEGARMVAALAQDVVPEEA